MRNRWFTCVRLSDSYLTILIPPFHRIVHDRSVTGTAAYGSLKPIPVDRLRRTYLHLRNSIALEYNAFIAHRVPHPSLFSSEGWDSLRLPYQHFVFFPSPCRPFRLDFNRADFPRPVVQKTGPWPVFRLPD